MVTKLLASIVELEIDVERGEADPLWINQAKRSIIERILDDSSLGKEQLSFYPDQGYEEKSVFEIEAYHVDFANWAILRSMMNQIEGEYKEPDMSDYSLVTVEVNGDSKYYLKKEELDLIFIPTCNPYAEISSTETIRGNWYDSNADTNGTLSGGISVWLQFLYLKDFDRYVIVRGDYYCM